MRELIEGRADWRRSDVQDSDTWITQLTAADAVEVRAAVAIARARGKTCTNLEREDFPLPTVSAKLIAVRDKIEDGLGFHLIRGFPTDGFGKDDLRLIFWGLGKYFGTAISQSLRGDLIGDVRDMHLKGDPATARGYTSNGGQGFHTDSCDVSALFVLRQGVSGGESRVESAVAIHNEMLRLRPDLAEVLYQPFYWSWQGQEEPGQPPYYQQPVFSKQDDAFACRIISPHIYSAQAFPAVPRLTPEQIEAINFIHELCGREEFQVNFLMRPGDLEILNSHVTFHGRTQFEDGPDDATTRHLLRMWLSTPTSRPLSPMMSALYRDQRAGAVRGGFPSRTGTHVFETRVSTD